MIMCAIRYCTAGGLPLFRGLRDRFARPWADLYRVPRCIGWPCACGLIWPLCAIELCSINYISSNSPKKNYQNTNSGDGRPAAVGLPSILYPAFQTSIPNSKYMQTEDLDEDFQTGGFAIGPANWRESLSWGDEFGKTWDYGVEHFKKMTPEALAMILTASHYVVDALERKRRTAEEERLYDFCLNLCVDFM